MAMKSRAAIATLTASLAMALALAGPASAAPSYPTAVTVGGSGSVGTDLTVFGFVTSPKAACVGGRTVSIYAHYPSGKVLLADVASSSSPAGFYFGGGDFSFGLGTYTVADSAIVKVAKRTIGPRSHPATCRAAHATYP
jgi:hypothetical protein